MIRYQITDGVIAPSASADFIQVRNSALSARELAALVRSVQALHLPGAVIVNDRLDVALAAGAAGVHLKSNGISPGEVRRIAPAGFVVSVACHSEADVAGADGADYAVLSPIFSPISKRDACAPLGLNELGRIVGRSPIRILALGGITEFNTKLCVAAGAAGVAGVSLFGSF